MGGSQAKQCAACGSTFGPRSRSQVFCSIQCAGRSKRRPEATCPCGRTFRARWRAQRYCSRACAGSARRRAPRAGACLCCGVTFAAATRTRRFCSRACAHHYPSGHRTHDRICPACGSPFQTSKNDQRYCSVPCAAKSRRRKSGRRQYEKTCPECSGALSTPFKQQRYCSLSCARARQKAQRVWPNWKGGRTKHSSGYIQVHAPDHPRARGKRTPYVLEHILVMETVLGRYLEPDERVHHKNGRRDDNEPENLELWRRTQPSGVRATDYHCPGCQCRSAGEQRAPAVQITEDRGTWVPPRAA